MINKAYANIALAEKMAFDENNTDYLGRNATTTSDRLAGRIK